MALKYKTLNTKVNLKPTTFYRRHHDRFELFRNAAPDWYTTHNYHMTDVAGIQIPVLIKIPYGNILASISHRYEHIYSNKLGLPMAATRKVPGENAQFDKQSERFHTGAQLAYTLDLEKVYVSGGVFVSHYSSIKKKINTYPAIEASYAIAKHARIIASYNEAMRLPTFTDLYYSGPTNVGNADLKPEKSRTMELGAKYTKEGLQIQTSAFVRNGNNIIEWVKTSTDPANALWKTQNLTHIKTTGINLSVNITQALLADTDMLRQLSINYTWLDLKADADRGETKYINDNLKHNLSIRLSHKIVGGFYADWGIHLQDRAGSYTEYKNNRWGEEKPYEPYWLLNIRTGWAGNRWNIFGEVYNALDKQHFDISNVPQPGIWVQFGAAFKTALK